MNYVSYKGNRVPIFNTPLSNAEMLQLRENHDTFLIKDVRLGAIKCISNNIQLSRFHFDLGFRPMLYTTALVFVIYNYIQTKKKIKKVMPFSFGGDIAEFVKENTPKNGAKVVEL
jgi:hypothetical protein